MKEPRYIFFDGVCAAFALVAMGAEVLQSKRAMRIVAILIMIPPLVVLVGTFVGSIL